MELNNETEVKAPIEEVWAAFTDVERIAPCLPGAQLQEIEGDEFRGIVKVKVGPITAQYKGKAMFLEQNKDEWRVKLKADGRDTRGAGNASAVITATLAPLSEASTKLNVDTDLTITGKVAQFGRGAIADVSAKLMGQFADNVEKMLESGPADSSAAPAAPTAETTESAVVSAPAAASEAKPTVRKIDSPEPEAVDLLEVAGTPMLKRVAPVLGVLLLLLILRRLLGGD
jgi:carbon monoxide dehydrogenase subunit G